MMLELNFKVMKFESIFLNNFPVFLAPMAGITDAPFRKLVSSFGASAVISEMISSEALVRNSQKTYKRLGNSDINNLKIVQIVGSNPENMAKSAIINEELGADVIDINMGCPAKKIVSNHSGAALMKNEELAVAIAEHVVKSVKIPVTVKMRLGWDIDNINFLTLAKKFEDIGIRMLSIHCRTRNQMYSGKANWSIIKKLKDIITIPYICNGDIKSPNDAIIAIKQSEANGIMIGRGVLGKPWLLKQIMNILNRSSPYPTPSLSEQFEIVMKHFSENLDFYGELHGIKMFRKHFCWYSNGLNGSSDFRTSINKMNDTSSIIKCVKELYQKQNK